jgi:two-component system response regulator NreC
LRILLADDQGVVRRGMRALLETEAGVEIVAEASDGQEALRLLDSTVPDLVILDVAMPRLNGIDVAAQARKRRPGLRVIVLSMYSDESYVVRALAAGARGYLLKEATDDDLLPAVRAVAAGKTFFSPAVSAMLLEDHMRHLEQRGLEDSYHLLTDREREVLQLLAEGHSNREVAAALDVGLSTVETHRANLMQKLNLHNTAEIVLYAVRKRVIV